MNLALNRPVVVDSRTDSTTDGDKAVDGSTEWRDSKWVSSATGSHSIEVDLGPAMSVDEVRIWTGEQDYSFNPLSDYRVQGWNGTTWIDLVPSKTNTQSGAIDETFTATTVSKVKFSTNTTQAKVYEFEVFSSNSTPSVSTGSFEYDQPVQQVKLQFAGPIDPATLAGTDIQLVNQTTSQSVPGSPISVTFDRDTCTAVVRWPAFNGGILVDGDYQLSLASGSVLDPVGNPITAFSTSFWFLQGDATRNRFVDTQDFNVLAGHFGAPGSFSQGNLNYDSSIDSVDFTLLVSRYGRRLAAGVAPLAVFAPGISHPDNERVDLLLELM